MNWYKIELNEDQTAIGRIQDEFSKWFMSLNARRDVALFSRRHPKDYGETLYIYSKSAVHGGLFSRLFRAAPCEPPVPDRGRDIFIADRLTFLVGDANLRDKIIEEISRDSSAG